MTRQKQRSKQTAQNLNNKKKIKRKLYNPKHREDFNQLLSDALKGDKNKQ